MGSNLVRPRGCQVGTQGSTRNVSFFQRASCLLISAGARESTHPSNAFSDDVNKFNRTANQRRRSTGANEGVALVGRRTVRGGFGADASEETTCSRFRHMSRTRNCEKGADQSSSPSRSRPGGRVRASNPISKICRPGLSNHQGVHLSRPHARFTRAPSNSVIRKPPEFNLQDKRRR
jgi:hypothetical protein